MQPPRHLDDSNPRYVPAPPQQTRIVGVLLRRFHVSGRILVLLASELCLLRLGAVTQKRFDVGAKRIGIRRRRHERVVEVYVHLAEQRMEPVVHVRHRRIVGDVGAHSPYHLGVGVLSSHPGRCSSASAVRRTSPLRSSFPRTIDGERTPC